MESSHNRLWDSYLKLLNDANLILFDNWEKNTEVRRIESIQMTKEDGAEADTTKVNVEKT